MVKSQVLEVKYYYPKRDIEIFGPLLMFPPTRKLEKTKIALIKKRMMKKPYFGAGLLPDFDSGTELEKSQKKAVQKAFALGMDMGYTAQRRKFIETLLSETDNFDCETPQISARSSAEEIISFLSDPGFHTSSPRTIYTGLCRAWKTRKNPKVVKFLNETDYQGDPAHMLEKSKASEAFFGEFLSNHGILYQTQEELVKEYHETKISVIGEIADRLETAFQKDQVDEVWEPVPKPTMVTPDFLLRHPIVVWSGTDYRYHQVKWIEYKNQFGMKGPLYQNTVKQIQKYVRKWGPGAIVYSLGIAEDFSIPECPECAILDFPKMEQTQT